PLVLRRGGTQALNPQALTPQALTSQGLAAGAGAPGSASVLESPTVTRVHDPDGSQRSGSSRADRRWLAPPVPGARADFERRDRATYPHVFATCLGVLGGDPVAAEDCAQDAFVRAFRAWGRWRREAPADLWLHRIAVNVARTYRRSRH